MSEYLSYAEKADGRYIVREGTPAGEGRSWRYDHPNFALLKRNDRRRVTKGQRVVYDAIDLDAVDLDCSGEIAWCVDCADGVALKAYAGEELCETCEGMAIAEAQAEDQAFERHRLGPAW